MQSVIKVGRRYFAVPKELGLAEVIANRTRLQSNWNVTQQQQRNLRAGIAGARVVRNYR